MQYKTMIFDANRPVVQSITEPLNSGYGIAVKVKKDGEFLPYEQVKVDGKGSNANRDGWACFDLSTDNEIGVETISIEATVGAADTVYTHTFTGTDDQQQDGGLYVELELSDISGLPETISLKDVTGTINVTGNGFSITDPIGRAYSSGELPPGIPDGYTAYDLTITSPSTGYAYVRLTDQSNNVMWAKALMEEQPTFTVVPTATISTSDAKLAYSIVNKTIVGDVSYSANVELTVSGGEGSSSVIKFPLMVNKRDMGYIEPAEDKIQ